MKGILMAAMVMGPWIAVVSADEFPLFAPPPEPAEFHPSHDAQPAVTYPAPPQTAALPTKASPQPTRVAQAESSSSPVPEPLVPEGYAGEAVAPYGNQDNYPGGAFYQSPVGQGVVQETFGSPQYAEPQLQNDPYAIAPKGCYCEGECRCWTSYADGLYWSRSPSCNMALVRDGGVPQSGNPLGEMASRAVLLSAHDLNFDLSPGWRIGATKHNMWWGCDGEFLYFGLAPWSSSATVASPTVGQTLLSGAPYMYVSSDPQVVTWESELHNLEFNLRRPISPKTTVLGGFRTLYLGEEFTAGNINQDWYSIKTRNVLLGAQLGAEHDFWNRGGRLRITGIAKGGLCYNAARAEAEDLYGGIIGTRPGYVSADGGELALLSEIGLAATYQLTYRCAIRAGYQMLWACGVAMAPCQIDNLDMLGEYPAIPTPGATIYGDQIDMSNRLFAHGGYLGLEAKF